VTALLTTWTRSKKRMQAWLDSIPIVYQIGSKVIHTVVTEHKDIPRTVHRASNGGCG